MRPFLNSPKNGLFAGGIIFALGLHSGGEKWDLNKLSDLTATFFMQKYRQRDLPSDLPSEFEVQELSSGV